MEEKRTGEKRKPVPGTRAEKNLLHEPAKEGGRELIETFRKKKKLRGSLRERSKPGVGKNHFLYLGKRFTPAKLFGGAKKKRALLLLDLTTPDKKKVVRNRRKRRSTGHRREASTCFSQSTANMGWGFVLENPTSRN